MGKYLESVVFLFLLCSGVNLWNIYHLSEVMQRPDQCDRPVFAFFVGSIVCIAVMLVIYCLGFGSVFVLVWASLGQYWYLTLRCESSDWPTAMKYSIGALWFNLGTMFATVILMCAGGFRVARHGIHV